MAQKRTLDSFFTPTAKKARPATAPDEPTTHSTHEHYPFPILDLSPSSTREMASLPARPAKPITSHPDLDLLSFEPYIPPALAKELFTHLRANLPFYRVKYNMTRGGIQTAISTPRYTTVFGLDATALFNAAGHPVDAASRAPLGPDRRYDRIPPRPLPAYVEGALAETRERDNAILGGVRPEVALGNRAGVSGNGLASAGLSGLGSSFNSNSQSNSGSNALAEAGLNGGLEQQDNNGIGPFAISAGTLMSGFGSSSDEDDDDADDNDEDVANEVSSDFWSSHHTAAEPPRYPLSDGLDAEDEAARGQA
ncbi:hypothetical protein HYQ44_018494 [Verticillium longisporum]|nr:hypothetical protein HYQ44_018494 [Verticillium longisporum]